MGSWFASLFITYLLCAVMMTAAGQTGTSELESECGILMKLESLETRIQDQETNLRDQDTLNNELKSRMQEQEVSIRDQKISILEQDALITELKSDMTDKENRIDDLEADVNDKDNRISDLDTRLTEKEARIDELQTALSEQEAEIANLKLRPTESGAFLIPFIITIVVCGIPLYFLEFGVGKFSGKGPLKIWDVSPLFRGAGVTMFVAYFVWLFGSTIFRGWLFQFVFYTFQDPLPWTTCDNAWNKPTCVESTLGGAPSSGRPDNNVSHVTVVGYGNSTGAASANSSFGVFNSSVDNASVNDTTLLGGGGEGIGLSAAEEFWRYNILDLSTGLHDLASFQWKYVAFTFVWRAIVMVVVIFGIRAIEKMMYVCATFPVLVSMAILVRSLMLPGATDGLYLFFYPDMSRLLSFKIWIEAFIMAFYTLGFGWGCIILLGSHAKFRDSSVRVAIVTPVLDAVMAIFQGMVCFSVLGNMAAAQGVVVPNYASGGMVCFSVLGNMAAARGVPVEDVIEANISTGIIALVSALATLPLPQLWTLLFFLAVVLSSLDTQAGPYMFLIVDWYAGCWPGIIVALVEVVVAGWIYGLDRLSDDIKIMSGKSLPIAMHVGIAFTTPVFVAVIFVASILEYIPPVYGSYVYPHWARLLGWNLVALILSPIVIVALKRIYTERGTLIQRVRRLLKPNSDWGPADEVSLVDYDKSSAKFESRPYTDLLLYNVANKYRDETFKEQAAHEMKGLL